MRMRAHLLKYVIKCVGRAVKIMAAGKLDPALLSQIHLSGDVQCPLFTAHFLKPNICTACNKLINKHLLEAISDDHTLLKVMTSIKA